MFNHNCCGLILGLFSMVMLAGGQLNPAIPYCFHYTWIGPRYTNTSSYANATCDEALRGSRNIPCREPMVVSYDGSYPDISFIWENHALQATCPLAGSDVCLSYAFVFDGQFENTTHMCGRAVDEEGRSVTSGCYEEINGGRRTRVCVCRSVAGMIPCNSSHGLIIDKMMFSIFALILLYKLI